MNFSPGPQVAVRRSMKADRPHLERLLVGLGTQVRTRDFCANDSDLAPTSQTLNS